MLAFTKIVKSLSAFFVVFVLIGSPAFADSEILGLWIPEEKDSVYEMFTCGDAICGKVAELSKPLNSEGKPKVDTLNKDESLRSRPILGMVFLNGLVKKSKGKWKNGTIYNARDGKTYSALMKLKKDGSLEVRGYIGTPMLGKSNIWYRP